MSKIQRDHVPLFPGYKTMPSKEGTVSVPATIKKFEEYQKQAIKTMGEEGLLNFENRCGPLLEWLKRPERKKTEFVTIIAHQDETYMMVVKEHGIVQRYPIGKDCVANLVLIPQHKVCFEPIPCAPVAVARG